MRQPRLINPTDDLDLHIRESLGGRSQRSITESIDETAKSNPSRRTEIRFNGNPMGDVDIIDFVGFGFEVSVAGNVARVESRPNNGVPTVALAAAAGTTATARIEGTDNDFRLQIVPGGTGITTGSLATITFALARRTGSYTVEITPASSAARTLGMFLGTSTVDTTEFLFSTAVALTTGQTYVWWFSTERYE